MALRSSIFKPTRGIGWLPILLILAVVLVFGHLIAWMLGVALTLIIVAIKFSAALLLLLFVLYFIKKMATKVDS